MTVAADLRASPRAAWNLLVDTERWPEWGPSVRAVECDDRRVHAGSRGRVRVPGGFWVPFRVTGFEDGRRWSWDVARLPATGHRVTPAAGGCRVVFEVPPLAAGYVPVCRRALANVARLLADAD